MRPYLSHVVVLLIFQYFYFVNLVNVVFISLEKKLDYFFKIVYLKIIIHVSLQVHKSSKSDVRTPQKSVHEIRARADPDACAPRIRWGMGFF